MLVMIKTLVLFPYFVAGDLIIYNNLYESVRGANIIEGYAIYKANINSAEIVYYAIIWVSSNVDLNRAIFLAISNGLLAFLGFKRLSSSGNYIIVSVVLLFNLYADVLYFSAERLKFSILILLCALIARRTSAKAAIIAASIATHAQAALVILLISVLHLDSKSVKCIKKNQLKNLIFISIALTPIFFTPLFDHAIAKIVGYNIDYGGEVPFRTLILCGALMVLSPIKIGAIMVAMFSTAAAFYLGPGRINFIIYYILLIVCLRENKILKRGVAIALASFGAYQDLSFLENVFSLGTGFERDGSV